MFCLAQSYLLVSEHFSPPTMYSRLLPLSPSSSPLKLAASPKKHEQQGYINSACIFACLRSRLTFDFVVVDDVFRCLFEERSNCDLEHQQFDYYVYFVYGIRNSIVRAVLKTYLSR